MNLKWVIVFLGFVFPELIFGQVRRSVYFDWEQRADSHAFTFRNQTGVDDKTLLPKLRLNIKLEGWDGDPSTIQCRLTQANWQSLSIAELKLNFNSSPLTPIAYHPFQYCNEQYLAVEIVPFDFVAVPSKLNSAILEVDYNKSVNSQSTKLKSQLITQSVLNDGKWVRISVAETGVHRIPYSKISSWGFSDPGKVNVYGQGGKMLSKNNSDERLDDIVQNKCWHYNDAIYFFAQGAVDWYYNELKEMFTHQLNDYGDKGYYFLTQDDAPSSISTVNYNDSVISVQTSSFDDFDYFEKEEVSVIRSGRTWYGKPISGGSSSASSLSFSFPNLISGSNGRLSTVAIGRGGSLTTLDVSVDDAEMPTQTLYFYGVTLNSSEGNYAREASMTSDFLPGSDNISINLSYNANGSDDLMYLDKVDIQVKRSLKATGDQMLFRDRSILTSNAFGRYNIELTSDRQVVWDITRSYQPINVSLGGTGVTQWFNYPVNDLKEFVVFDPDASLPVPEFVESVENQNLHAISNVDYIIVAANDFVSEAQRLAQFHEKNGLKCKVVTQQQIFNEFSSGCPDVTAIRSFLTVLNQKSLSEGSSPVKYLLLFGDGLYINRNLDFDKYVLTYQSVNSINYSYTFVTDDFFGCLDENEGDAQLWDVADIGIGRFPVHTLEEAQNAVDKSIGYVENSANDKWRNSITFIADDGDDNLHITDADTLAKKVAGEHPQYNINEIYFDSYPKVSTSSGQKYPAVEEAIDETISNGTLIFNYSGHGGVGGLAHEGVVTNDKINSWTNINKLPLFVTATCEFSRFDDEKTSAGENVFLNPVGGGVALFTTTRIAYAQKNIVINKNFYNCALNVDDEGHSMRFGDMIKHTKMLTSGSENEMNFTLLGDPGLRLQSANQIVETSTINNKSIEIEVDTLKALSVAKIEADIHDLNGDVISDFNGFASVTVYDKATDETTLGNGGAEKYNYKDYKNILYDGVVEVTNGAFEANFMVPKDIDFEVGKGRISYYAYSDDKQASGYFNKVNIGEYQGGADDTQGPGIELWLNSVDFVDNDVVGSTPLLLARVTDENGINTSGLGIGHDIILTIDEGETDEINLNRYYRSDLGSYQSGSIEYQLPELTEGEHTAKLKLWDSYNNSSEKTITFIVTTSNKLTINNISVYPVPVQYGESLYVEFSHNDPNAILDVTYTIVDLSGRKIFEGEQTVASSGIEVERITVLTAGSYVGGLKSGFYLLNLDVVSSNGKKTRFCQKMMIVE